MKKILLSIALAVCTHSSSAIADSNIEFMVSGVLRSKDDGNVIKLVHAAQFAPSAKEAASAFTNEALKQYPNFTMLDVIASPLEAPAQSCNKFPAI